MAGERVIDECAALRELTEEEVVAAARSFWLDDWCERVDDDDEPALPYEV